MEVPHIDPSIAESGLEKFYRAPDREKLEKFIDTYPHWQDFIHRDFGTLSALELWAYMKTYRRSRKKDIHIGTYTFSYTVPDILFESLHKIDTTVGGTLITNGLIPKGEQERYYLRGLIDESIASSQIEGAATTKKVAEAMIQTGRKPKIEMNKGLGIIFLQGSMGRKMLMKT